MNTADLGTAGGRAVDGALHRPVRADHAAGRAARGTADRRSVFEVFTRRLPEGRRYGVVAGTGRVLDAVENFRFDARRPRLPARAARSSTSRPCDWLAGYRFSGDIWGYPEGEVYFPGSPILRVEGTFAECVLLETVILSILNHDSAIAAAASRMAVAAGGRPLIEMGARRTHELAAVAAVPGRVRRRLRHHLRPRGRLPLRHPHRRHQRPRLHPAARHRAGRLHRPGRLAGPRHHAAGGHLRRGRGGAHRRRDRRARSWARSASTPATCCWSPTGCASSWTSWAPRTPGSWSPRDLDEYAIASLAAAPVDAYGVGTQLVTGSGHPTCSMVYKLVARAESDDPDAPLRAGGEEVDGRQDLASAAASGRRGGWTRTAWPRPR